MLKRTFPLMSRRCNQLTRVAFAGIALAIVAPLPLIAADEGAIESRPVEERESEELSSADSKPDQADEDRATKQGTAKRDATNRDMERPRQGRDGRRNREAQGNAKNGDEQKADRVKAELHSEGETPALGVLVGSCPGNAVCVKGVIAGSPADDAGLQEGDYILSIDNEQVASPEQLRQAIDKMQEKENVKLRFWREGNEQTEEVTLASKADQPPESHRAWLGVMLALNDGEGLTVGRVLPGSPASDARLQEDDVIQKLNDKQVKDLPSFLECIEDMGPGTEVSMVVDRDGSEQTLKAQLGDIEEAPMAFIREAMRHTFQEQGEESWGSDQLPPMMEETLDEMRNRIRALEKQVKEMQNDTEEANAGNALVPRVSPGNALADEFSDAENDQETLVVQRGRNRSYQRGNSFTPRYRGNTYYNRTPYRSGYRYGNLPIYRSPGSGYSYYRYGGRPYYYGGYGRPYGYGYRSGIQIGRNFGVYW